MASTAFRNVLRGAQKGELIVPVLQAYLHNPSFDEFVVHTEGFEVREPDGWFHPSTHPLWEERLLYHYLAHGKNLVAEPFDPTSTLAVTAGKFWHSFLGRCLVECGVVSELEVYVEDRESLSRGAMDGIGAWGVYELKTMNPNKMRKIKDLDTFREACPDYYAQGQEYMRMSGLVEHRTLIIGTEYPFEMKEIVMPFDRVFAMEIRDKYRRVLQAVADQRPPRPCCNEGSKETKTCPARLVCSVALS